MLTILIAALFVLAGAASIASLIDSWLIARAVAAELSCERELARLGFVPQVAAQELRNRAGTRLMTGQSNAQKGYCRALPLRFAGPACDAA